MTVGQDAFNSLKFAGDSDLGLREFAGTYSSPGYGTSHSAPRLPYHPTMTKLSPISLPSIHKTSSSVPSPVSGPRISVYHPIPTIRSNLLRISLGFIQWVMGTTRLRSQQARGFW